MLQVRRFVAVHEPGYGCQMSFLRLVTFVPYSRTTINMLTASAFTVTDLVNGYTKIWPFMGYMSILFSPNRK